MYQLQFAFKNMKKTTVAEAEKREEIFCFGTKLCFFESQILQNHC